MSRPTQLLFLLLAITAVVYWPGLTGPLVFDDHQNLAPMKEWLAGEKGVWRVIFDNTSGLLGRPVSMASLVLNVQLLGPDVWGLKLGNVVIHLVTGALVYWLLTLLIRIQPPVQATSQLVARWLPSVVAGLWLLHPLQVSTTLYVIQRMAMLSAMFTLITLIAYIAAREAVRADRRTRAAALFTVACAATLLATFSKENGVLAPALCALIEFWLFVPAVGQRRHPLSWVFVLGALVAPAFAALIATLAQSHFIVAEYANRPFTLVERLMTQGRVLWDYLGALLLPYGPRLGLYHDDYVISHGWFSPATTLLAWLGWIVAFLTAWRLRQRAPGIGLGLGFYLVAQALESSVFPLLMYFEHRTYLPSVGALWAIASLVILTADQLAPRMHHPRRVFVAATAALLGMLAVATFARANVWQSQQSLLAQGLEYHPQSRWLRTDVAQELMQLSPPDMEGARAHVDALVASPQDSTRRLAGVWQLLIDCSMGRPAMLSSKSLAFSGVATDIEADLLLAVEALSNGILKRNCAGLGRSELAAQLAQLTDTTLVPQSHFNVRRLRFKAAQLYQADGNTASAIMLASNADSGAQADAPIGAFLAELLLTEGRNEDAKPILARLRSQIPGDDETGQAVLRRLEKQAKQPKSD